MRKKKKTDTNVPDKKEDDFLKTYIENQFTQKNPPSVQDKNLVVETTNKKKQYFA